jgi:hypothetical protein
MDWTDVVKDRDRWQALVNARSIKSAVFLD